MRRASLSLFVLLAACHSTSEKTEAPRESAWAPFARVPDVVRVREGTRRFADHHVAATSSVSLDSIAPRDARGALEVKVGGGEVFDASLRPLATNATPCRPEDDGRTILCKDAWSGVDLAMIAGEARAELFPIVRDARALVHGHARFSFALASEHLHARQEQGRVALLDRNGVTRLVIPAPWAVDGRGVRRDVAMRLHDGRLDLDLDATDLTTPILVDPGLETATFTDVTPTGGLPTVHLNQGWYDETKGAVVLWGGSDGPGYTQTFCRVWDGTAVTNCPAGPALHSIPMVFARRRGVAVGFGGVSGAYIQGHVIDFDGTTWTSTTWTPSPSARYSVGLAYDDKRDIVVLFGGINGSTLHGDTWEMTTGAFAQKSPTTKPPARLAPQMAYDLRRNVTVMFGGMSFPGTSTGSAYALNDTWEWDGTDWKEIKPTTSPGPNAGGALLWDDVSQRLLLVGGNSTESWGYDGTNWSRLTTTGLARRVQGAFAYDRKRKAVVAYAGHSGNAIGGLSSAWGTLYSSLIEWKVTACTSSADCGGGSCVAGYCCSTTCTGACEACNSDGTCTPLKTGSTPSDTACLNLCTGGSSCSTSCSGDGDCVAGARCVGSKCLTTKPLGAVCTTNAECTGGACVDGVCCDRPCSGACEACDVAGKVGTCSTVPAGKPHGARSCGGSGVCAGACNGTSKACTFPASTVVCSVASCSGDLLSAAANCDGAGSCAKLAAIDCAPYKCGTTGCTTSCASGTDCSSNAYCSGTTCLAKKPEGTPCTSPSECLGGTCLSTGACGPVPDAGPEVGTDTGSTDTGTSDTGVVADTGPSDSGSSGDSTVVDSSPEDTGTTDVATTPAPVISEPKVPAEFQRCTKSSECSTGFCVDGVCCDSACEDRCHTCALLSAPGKCTLEPEGVDLRNVCGPANTCLGTCGKGGECIGSGAGTMCARNRCVSASKGVGPAYCAGPGAKCPTDTATPFDCGPYTCEPAFGACLTACVESGDCANGYVCDVEKKTCVAPAPAAEDDSGCSYGHSGPTGGALLLFGLALAARRRRD